MNPNLFPTYPPDSPFEIMQQHAHLQQLNANLSDMSITDTKQNMRQPLMNMVNNVDAQQLKLEGFEVKSHSSDQPIENRLRNKILPEQRAYLYEKYQIESRPSSETLENIAREVGLKKGHVENWFKTRRAHERNGQFRIHAQVVNKRFELKNHSSDQPIDKRLRTKILPEQLDYLYVKYQIESRPSSKMLENIAREVGLKKGHVENWFKIRRARERNGELPRHAQVVNKRCPFCPAFFRMSSALESHLTTKHASLPGCQSYKAKL